jgi:hypothetical protein
MGLPAVADGRSPSPRRFACIYAISGRLILEMAARKVARGVIAGVALLLVLFAATRFIPRKPVGGAVQPVTSTHPEPIAATPPPRPEKETIEGFFHKDRWGVGKVGGTLASLDLLEQLAPFEGKPVRVAFGGPVHTWNQHVDMFRELKNVESLPTLPLKILAASRSDRLQASRPFEVVIHLENTGTLPVRVRQLHASLFVRYARPKGNLEILEATNEFFPYRTEQRSYSIKYSRMGLTPTKAIDAPMTDPGDLHVASAFLIEPGDRFPLSLEFSEGLPPEEYELALQVLSLEDTPRGQDQWALAAAWIPLDVHPARETPKELPAPGFRVEEKHLYKDVNSQYLLEVRLLPNLEGPHRIISRSRAKGEMLLAGRMKALDLEGRPISLRTFGCYSGSALGEDPWRVDPIPEGGLLARVRFWRTADGPPIQTIQLDLMSERGLERVILGDMPASFQSVKFIKQDN